MGNEIDVGELARIWNRSGDAHSLLSHALIDYFDGRSTGV